MPGSDKAVRDLEEGLNEQVRQMSQRLESAAVPAPEEIGPWSFLGALLVGGLSVSLATLVGLRKWNQWLDREAAKRLNALADDPLMAEFLRALHENSQNKPTEKVLPKPGQAEAVQNTTVADPKLASGVVRENVAELRADFQKLGRASDEAESKKILHELLKRIEVIKAKSGQADLRPAKLLAFALHGLLNQLSVKAANITASSSRTTAAGIDLLELLCRGLARADLATSPPVRLLAVDDDAISRRAVSLALKKAFTDPDLASDGQIALAQAQQHAYDVIFLDIEMPGMDGFELCKKIRQTSKNSATPIVFVTSHSDFDYRAKSALSGANDLIGKPFLAFEITVKALTLVLRTRQEQETKSALAEIQKAQADKPVVAKTAADPIDVNAKKSAEPVTTS